MQYIDQFKTEGLSLLRSLPALFKSGPSGKPGHSVLTQDMAVLAGQKSAY